jgi:hypothetical protein
MALLRFATVRDLYDAFPTALDDIGIAASDMPSLDFLRMLASMQVWDAAISFCAYLLPRREAVWWGCQSLRRMIHLTPPEDEMLAIAESWVREPEEHHRRAALACGYGGDTRLPATWMARAAGWSGGSIVAPRFGNVPAASEQTARAVRAGLMIALMRVPNEYLDQVMAPAITAGIELAAGPGRPI